jgi:hypothetical protein
MAERSSTSSSSPLAEEPLPPDLPVQAEQNGVIPATAERPGEVALLAPETAAKERAFGFPWALVLALLIVAGVEVALHTVHWQKHIPYDIGPDEYHAAALRLDLQPPAQVAVIGSSRSREAVVVPELRERIETALGQPVTVANYSLSGANAYDEEAMVRRLLRASPPPKLIVCGVAERDFASRDDQYDRAPLFWDWQDWTDQRRRRGLVVLDDLPVLFRNWLGRHWYTLGRRDQVRLALRNALLRQPPASSPVDGQMTLWQAAVPQRSLINTPVEPHQMRAYVSELRGKPYPDAGLVDCLARAIDACRAAGVPLILYENPVPPVLRQYLPAGMYRQYVATVTALAEQHGVPFVKVGDLGVTITNDHFREQSHMNYPGAHYFGGVLAQRVVIPTLTHSKLLISHHAPKRKHRARHRPHKAATAAPAPTAHPAPTSLPQAKIDNPKHKMASHPARAPASR